MAKRSLLVAGAILLALLSNFARALFLIWIAATENVSAVERWHDIAGYVIVAVVFCGSLLLAAALAKRGMRNAEGGIEKSSHSQFPISHSPFAIPHFPFILSLLCLLAIEIGVEGWYRSHERGLIARERWTARWPETARDFHDIHMDERTRRILRFDEGRGATWRITGGTASVPSTTQQDDTAVVPPREEAALLYFFRWRPGSNSALLANVHRPDVCLPASGWVQRGDYGIRSYRITENFSLPFRHFLFAQPGPAGRQRFAHAFFCSREDKVRNDSDASLAREEFAQEPSEWSRREKVNLVLQGRRHLGQQVMEFVLLTREEVGREQAEAQFASLVPELVERK